MNEILFIGQSDKDYLLSTFLLVLLLVIVILLFIFDAQKIRRAVININKSDIPIKKKRSYCLKILLFNRMNIFVILLLALVAVIFVHLNEGFISINYDKDKLTLNYRMKDRLIIEWKDVKSVQFNHFKNKGKISITTKQGSIINSTKFSMSQSIEGIDKFRDVLSEKKIERNQEK